MNEKDLNNLDQQRIMENNARLKHKYSLIENGQQEYQ